VEKGGAAWPREFIVEDIKNGLSVYMTARWHSRIVGLIVLEKKKNAIMISDLFVSKSHRKRKIASQLLLAAGEFCLNEGYNKLKLHVREDNETARKLYLNFGFRVIKKEEHYYEDFATALLMETKLPFHCS
jgi:ribosomal protein S18 acetylase RimI-like enzyme